MVLQLGKSFVREIASLLQAYADESKLEAIALKACMVMQVLLLQKPSPHSISKDHTLCLQRRLELQKNRDIKEPFKEGQCLQARLCSSQPSHSSDQVSRIFSKLMMLGKTKAALQYLFRNADKGVLNLDDFIEGKQDTVRNILEDLHPTGKDPHPESLLPNDTESSLPTDPILFESLDGSLIQQVARQCNGSAGPTGLDARAWRRMCTSFGRSSWNLCSAIACVARCICTKQVDPEGLSAFVACRLILLNKCPGVRPIGVGEVLHRTIGKAVMRIVQTDVATAAGLLQVCASLQGGCEAAVHAMREVINNDYLSCLGNHPSQYVSITNKDVFNG